MTPDFGATAGDYALHRSGFPDSLFTRLAAFGVGQRGQVLVDLGTGTGTLARGFARRGCSVVGIDPSESMLEQARLLDAAESLETEYRSARAESTGLPDRLADVVSAGQCWHWFDRPRAAREVLRILRPGGTLVIAHFDWLPLAGNVVEATERLIQLHNPDWHFGGGLGIHPQWLRDLGEARYRNLETFSYDVDIPYSPEAWRGRTRASAGVGATHSPEAVRGFDDAHARMLGAQFPADVLQIPHRVFAVIGVSPV
jgi:SAM-dependent methyltransferase